MMADDLGLNLKESSIINDKEFLVLKNSIIEKVVHLFSRLEKKIRDDWYDAPIATFYPKISKTGKITKGEKYKDLPYVVLDFPAVFSKTDILAYRSLFWWGNYFSNQFILKGVYLDMIKPSLIKCFPHLIGNKVYLDLSSDPWNHDKQVTELMAIDDLSPEQFNEILINHPFLKLVWYLPLNDADRFAEFTRQNLHKIIGIISSDSD